MPDACSRGCWLTGNLARASEVTSAPLEVAIEMSQVVGFGEGDLEVGWVASRGRVVDQRSVGRLHPVDLAGIGEVPADRDLGVPGLRAVDANGETVEHLGDRERRGHAAG